MTALSRLKDGLNALQKLLIYDDIWKKIEKGGDKNIECEKTDGIYTGKRIGDFWKRRKRRIKSVKVRIITGESFQTQNTFCGY